MAANKLNVSILNPHHTMFYGEASSLSLKNELGTFDILPQHANFVSTIQEFIVLYHGRNAKRLTIDRGIVYCRENTVKIFVGVPNQPVLPTKPSTS